RRQVGYVDAVDPSHLGGADRQVHQRQGQTGHHQGSGGGDPMPGRDQGGDEDVVGDDGGTVRAGLVLRVHVDSPLVSSLTGVVVNYNTETEPVKRNLPVWQHD